MGELVVRNMIEDLYELDVPAVKVLLFKYTDLQADQAATIEEGTGTPEQLAAELYAVEIVRQTIVDAWAYQFNQWCGHATPGEYAKQQREKRTAEYLERKKRE